MKKNLSLLAMALFAMFLFPLGVDAASFRLECDPSHSLNPGESTTCTVSLVEAASPITGAIIDITNEDMAISPFQANATAWTSSEQNGSVILTSINGAFTSGALGNFVATLNKDMLVKDYVQHFLFTHRRKGVRGKQVEDTTFSGYIDKCKYIEEYLI